MKRNFTSLVATSAAPVAAGQKLSFADLTEKCIALVHADISLREARAYVRENCPDLSPEQKITLDRAVVLAVCAVHGIVPVQASKNPVFSGLTFSRTDYKRPYNAIEYFRLTLNGLGGGKKAEKAKAEKAEKAQQTSTPEADAAKIAKARSDAAYLVQLAQALMVEASKLVTAAAK